MAVGTGAALSIRTVNVDKVVEALSKSAREIRLPASREMRKAAREIGAEIIVPVLPTFAARADAPQAPKMAASARAINDRIPVVKVGYVHPKLSGFKRTKVDRRKTSRGSLAWGTELGPKGGRRRGRPTWADPAEPVNHYKNTRTGRGQWVQPALESGSVIRRVLEKYGEAAEAIFKKYGLT
jgi:hypothetical protein